MSCLVSSLCSSAERSSVDTARAVREGPENSQLVKAVVAAAVQEGLGIAAEHGFFFRAAGPGAVWQARSSTEEMSWQGIVEPILQQYTESTDGSFVEKKESALVWHYNAADPDFGSLQVHKPSFGHCHHSCTGECPFICLFTRSCHCSAQELRWLLIPPRPL